MNYLTALPSKDRDPAALIYPPTFPIELALRMQPVAVVCASYGIDYDEWELLKQNPVFIEDLKRALDELRKDGSSFRLKARLQAEELLKTTWAMIHDDTGKVPQNVRADLAKFTIRAAGLDGSKDQAANAVATNALQINIDLR